MHLYLSTHFFEIFLITEHDLPFSPVFSRFLFLAHKKLKNNSKKEHSDFAECSLKTRFYQSIASNGMKPQIGCPFRSPCTYAYSRPLLY